MKTLLAVILSVPAAAHALDWSADPMRPFQAALHEAAPIASPASSPVVSAPVSAPLRLQGRPVGDNTTSRMSRPSGTLYFSVNRQQDRVGARLWICDDGSPLEEDCREMLYVFPGLSYERSSKMVYHGTVPVARLGNFVWNQWQNPRYRLGWQRRTSMIDGGFDRYQRDTFEVHIDIR